MRRARGRLAALVLLAGAVACTTPVAPHTRVHGPLAPGLDRVLYVTSNTAHENVVADLELAGFRSTSDWRETPLQLVVKLGRVRLSRPCGQLRNVSYQLRHAGIVVAVIKGRGWVGSCQPNLLLEMNAALARLFDAGV